MLDQSPTLMDLAILKALNRSYKKRRNEEEGRIEGRKGEGGRRIGKGERKKDEREIS